MKGLIAKRYAKALISSSTKTKLPEYTSSIKKIADAMSLEKFRAIIYSPDISVSQKEGLLLDIIGECDDIMRNFIKSISYHRRFDIAVELYNELRLKLAQNKNEFVGYIDSSYPLSEEEIDELKTKFSSKINSNINLIQRKSDFDGIKIEIDDLGIEIGFSKTKLQNQMVDFIVKAI